MCSTLFSSMWCYRLLLLASALWLVVGCGSTTPLTPDAKPIFADGRAGKTDGGNAESGMGTCIPSTCMDQDTECGTAPDGCGGIISCGGACPTGQTCGGGTSGLPNVCGMGSCTPTTCTKLGLNCGTISDGCGGALSCGTCSMGQMCAAGSPGQLNLCGTAGVCTPMNCQFLRATCGMQPDGCGNILNCGTCPVGQNCGAGNQANNAGSQANNCGMGTCMPTSCMAMLAKCGALSDGCGNILNCGSCPMGQTCGSGGIPNQCN